MDPKKLEEFLYEARSKTYAGNDGKVESPLPGVTQLEYAKEDWLYRDLYYNGKNGFNGMEGVYFKNKPVWASNYHGIYNGILEDELDRILRKALLENPGTRSYNKIDWQQDNYRYVLDPDIEEDIESIAGTEKIYRGANQIYTFYYGGQLLG